MSAEKEYKGFLMFLSHWEMLSELPPDVFKRVMQALFATAGADCEMPEDMNLVERIAYTALSGDVQRSLSKYDERRRKCATAGRKGGLRKAENAEASKNNEDALVVQIDADGINDEAATLSDARNNVANASDARNNVANASDARNDVANASDARNDVANASDARNNVANASDARNDVANASDARNIVANLAKDKDKDKATDKAKAMAMAKESIKPLSFVDAGPLRWAGTCAAGAAPEACVPLPSSASGSGTPSAREVNAHFETLWALYPSKRGKNQVTAKAKRRLMQVDAAAMETAIARYVAEVEAAPYDRQWLNGSTWFNGRYQDYLGDDYAPKPVLSGARPSARSRETSYRSSEEARSRAAYIAALEE